MPFSASTLYSQFPSIDTPFEIYLYSVAESDYGECVSTSLLTIFLQCAQSVGEPVACPPMLLH